MKYMVTGGIRRRGIHAAAIATLPTLLLACAEPVGSLDSTLPATLDEVAVPEEDYSMPDQQTLIEDSMYMTQMYEQRAQNSVTPEMQVELADDRQYRFSLHRLLAGGHTPENSPELFTRLRDAREQAIEGSVTPPSLGGTEPIGEAEQALGGANPCKNFIHIDEFTNSVETRFRPVAISSCYSGVQHTYTDLAAYSSNLDETAYDVLGTEASQAFGSPYSFRVGVSEPDPDKPGLSIGAQADPDALFVVDSLSAVTDNNDNQKFTYVTIKTVGADVPWPLTLKYQQINDVFGPVDPISPGAPCKGQGQCTLQMEHPKNLVAANLNTYTTPYDGDERIRVCVDRGYASYLNDINRDCDYVTYRKEANNALTIFPTSNTTGIAAVDPAVPQVVADPSALWPALPQYYTSTQYLPYKGKYNLYHPDPNCSIDAYDAARTQASLVLVDTGGFCNAGVAGDVQNVDLEKAFPKPGPAEKASLFNLLAKYGNCPWSINAKKIEAYVSVYTTAKGSSGGKCGSRFASVRVTPVDFKKSCFAEGTLIRRADGALVPVEELGSGDRVLSSSTGTTLTITAVARGAEPEPLVNLFDEDGHDLLLTRTHPVVTPNQGIVQAGALQPGDAVVTEQGVKTLVHVFRVEYHPEVFNFALGTAEELVAVGNDGRTMFADGYLVGDNEMQFDLERTVAASAIVRTVPPRWRVDYENARARGAVDAPPEE